MQRLLDLIHRDSRIVYSEDHIGGKRGECLRLEASGKRLILEKQKNLATGFLKLFCSCRNVIKGMCGRLMVRRNDSNHIIPATGGGEYALVGIRCDVMIDVLSIQAADDRNLTVVLTYLEFL